MTVIPDGLHLTEEDWHTIKCALGAAADQYRQDAQACVGVTRLREQFEKQALETQVLLEKLENEEEV